MPVRRLICFGVAAFAFGSSLFIAAQDITNPKSPEFKKKLTPIPLRTPEESRRQIAIHGEFEVQLVAAEPLVKDPVAIDFDEWGRAYVIELPQYNAYAVPNAKHHGSIALLTDTNADGVFDERSDFVSKLSYPTAIACWDGGIFVGDAPDLLYLKDTNGDGRADQRRVVFTGFGKDRAGEAHLNSIRWGLDNRFHLSTNLAGGDVRVAGSKKAAVSVRGRGFTFDPRDLTSFELTSGGGQHGMSMDDWGRKFVCSNSVPAQTLMYDDRYLKRNPFLKGLRIAVDIAPQGKFTKLYRISPDEPWRVLRTTLRRTKKFRGSDEGGKPFGFFTGATGITIYRGDAWPKEYRGQLFVGDVANNLVYRARLQANGTSAQPGVGLVAHRTDKEVEFLASRDIAFRPVQFANGPDGNLYMLDMYRELIEGAAFLPPEFLKYLRTLNGNDRGHIYRIVKRGKTVRKFAPLADLESKQLVALLEHPNGWHRDTASRLLYQRQDRKVIPDLQKLARTSARPIGRATALQSLAAYQALDEETIIRALSDDDAKVRIQTLRLAERLAPTSPLVRNEMARLIGDKDVLVRYQLAFSLGAIDTGARPATIARMLPRDGANQYIRFALMTSSSGVADAVFSRLAADAVFRKGAVGKAILVELASQVSAAKRNNEIAVVLAALARIPASEKSLTSAIVSALVEKQDAATRARITSAAGGKAGEILRETVQEAIASATNRKLSSKQRVEAVRTLRLAQWEATAATFEDLLQLQQPLLVQSAALETLGTYRNPKVASFVLSNWHGLSPSLRARAAEILLSRPEWIGLFLDAVAAKEVGTGDIDPSRVQLLRQHPDGKIVARVKQLFGATSVQRRQEVVEKYQASLELEGVAERGKMVFKKNCSACHRLEDVGTAVGADLKGIRQRGLKSVLLNVLDPNREVKPKFLTYVIQTEDGRILSGMIITETANGLSLRRIDGTTVDVRRNEIQQMRSTGLSFMPEGLEKQITVRNMADLLAYLNSLN